MECSKCGHEMKQFGKFMICGECGASTPIEKRAWYTELIGDSDYWYEQSITPCWTRRISKQSKLS